jgi:hypothetical protein
LVAAQSSSEIPEVLMNNPVYCVDVFEKLANSRAVTISPPTPGRT